MKWVLCWMTGKGSGPESRSTSYPSRTPAVHTAFLSGRALYSTPGVFVFSHAHAATIVMPQKSANRHQQRALTPLSMGLPPIVWTGERR
jgi:hypothetical protein